MAVLLRENAIIRGEEMEIKVFLPSGSLSRESRERAERLDAFLTKKVPPIAKRIMRFPKDKPLKKWYQFGKELHKLLDDNDLVLRSDLEKGLIWEAVKQHLPESMDLKGAGEAHDAKAEYTGSRGHFAECYAIARHEWEDVQWFKRWTDWTYFYHRGSMCRDRRVLQYLHEEIKKMNEYPSRASFSEILKSLSEQTTGKDIKILDDSVIAEKVHRAFQEKQPIAS